MGHQWLYLPLGKVIKKKKNSSRRLEITAITNVTSRKCANCFVEGRLFSSSGSLELFLVLPFVLLASYLCALLLYFILSFLSLTPHLNWLMANRQINGQPRGALADLSSPPSLLFGLSKLHVPLSDLRSHSQTSDHVTALQTKSQLEAQESQTRRLCCDHECVWHYVNSAYPVLIASAAIMSILKVKETIYCFQSLPGPPWRRPALAVGSIASSIYCLCHLICTLEHFSRFHYYLSLL